jgi:hypothetical protein
LYNGRPTAELKSKIATPEEMDRFLNAAEYQRWQRDYLA